MVINWEMQLGLNVRYKDIPMQLFFSKYSRKKDWVLLVTTDMSINYIKAVEIYQIRWSIEVFFKESKQFLQLGKSQSNDFDAQIADTTISIIVYLLLNLHKRFSDYETLGEIFREENQQLRELTLWEKLWGLFLEIIELLAELFDTDIEDLLQKVIADDRGEEKLILILSCLHNAQIEQKAD
jgi:hypothetical protein